MNRICPKEYFLNNHCKCFRDFTKCNLETVKIASLLTSMINIQTVRICFLYLGINVIFVIISIFLGRLFSRCNCYVFLSFLLPSCRLLFLLLQYIFVWWVVLSCSLWGGGGIGWTSPAPWKTEGTPPPWKTEGTSPLENRGDVPLGKQRGRPPLEN